MPKKGSNEVRGFSRQENTLHQELKEEIKKLKKRIQDLERERDILLALHKRDIY